MRAKSISDHNRVVRLEDWNLTAGDLNGTHNMSPILTDAWSQSTAAKYKLQIPVGSLLCGTTVPVTGSAEGGGGSGYGTTMANTLFVPGMTDGSACLKVIPGAQGIDLRRFGVRTGMSAASAPNAIGIQAGTCCALITAATQANPCVITTKYTHAFQTGDSIVIENVAGMTALNSNTYTVTRISSTAFSINANSSGFAAYTGKGLVRPSDLGSANNVARGVIEDVTVSGVRTGFHLQGWLNKQLGLKAMNCTLGFDGSYLNTNLLDLVTENCGQAVQLLGCTGLNILRLEDEGGGAGTLVAPSTIDYSQDIECGVWYTEGTRSTATEWLNIGGVSYCSEIHINGGNLAAAPSPATSVALGKLRGYTLPRRIGSGISTTANTTPGGTYPTYSATIPTSAPDIGTVVRHSAPVAGGNVGWIYCVGGVWQEFGVIEA